MRREPDPTRILSVFFQFRTGALFTRTLARLGGKLGNERRITGCKVQTCTATALVATGNSVVKVPTEA